jgi:hypothetical protein
MYGKCVEHSYISYTMDIQYLQYINHITITIKFLIHTSSILLGRVAGPDHSDQEQKCSGYNIALISINYIIILW